MPSRVFNEREDEAMSLILSVKQWWRHLRGDWIDEIIDEVKTEGVKIRDHIDDIYNRATLNGEDEKNGWLTPDRKRKKIGEILIDAGLLNEEQLRQGLIEQIRINLDEEDS
jgi:hypothetical protein